MTTLVNDGASTDSSECLNFVFGRRRIDLARLAVHLIRTLTGCMSARECEKAK